MAIICKLAITQFRNFNQQYINPGNQLNLFVADNAQGKTNLIEAIYYLGHNRSFKTKSIKEITQINQQQFQLDAQVDRCRIKLEKSKQKTIIHVDHLRLNNSSFLSKILPIQIITPDKGFVVNGTPKNKRSYLDWGVFHVEPDFLSSFKRYNKTLKHVNSLLAQQQEHALDDWFLEISKLSVIVNQLRNNYVQQLKSTNSNKLVEELSSLFLSINSFNYEFKSGWPKEVNPFDSESVYHYLLKNKNYLLKSKYLNYGPHKASLKFFLNNKEESFLSRGQQKTLSIIFWLTQVSLLVKNNVYPVVLIDDLASELDIKKIKTILHYLNHLNVQTFITDIGKDLSFIKDENPTIFSIKNGVITPQ